MYIPFVNASTTPAFSKYLRNSSFFASGVYKIIHKVMIKIELTSIN